MSVQLLRMVEVHMNFSYPILESPYPLGSAGEDAVTQESGGF